MAEHSETPTREDAQRTGLRAVCVIPALDEAGKIGRLLARFEPGTVEAILVVDDGSTDGTRDEARAGGARVISHERRRGVGAAIRTGIDYALEQGFDAVVVMGGDDQDDPAEIGQLLAPLERREADVVQGSRRLEGRRTVDMPLFRLVTTKAYSVFFRLVTGFRSTDATNGFRAFTTEVVRDERIRLHQPWLDTYELEPYLLYQAIRYGWRVREVQVTKRYHRDLGYSKMLPGRDWWRILRPIIFLRLGLRS
jgi:dolichol-phosphate mannosyltransferase